MTSQLQFSVSAAYIEESYCLCFLSNVAGVDLPIKSALKLSLLTVSWHYVNKIEVMKSIKHYQSVRPQQAKFLLS